MLKIVFQKYVETIEPFEMKYGKRYFNPERWMEPRYRKLSPDAKVLYQYLCENCDWAGFLPLDRERLSFDTQIDQDRIESTLNILEEEEIVINNNWLLVIDFIEMQDNAPLNPSNPAHKNIINKLGDNHGFFIGCDRAQKYLAPYMDLVWDNSNSKAIGKGNCEGEGNGKLIWNEDYGCNLCGANKGEECKFNGECHFPENCL